LERVVQNPKGTAYKTVRLPNVRIAGKTGTAEVGGRLPDHAWFAGYVPAQAPRVAFVVVVEHGGSGGKVAGPIARDFVKLLIDTGVVSGTRELAKE
jgi:penicillin-binding protein 2